MQSTATSSDTFQLEIKFKLVQLCFIVHSGLDEIFSRLVLDIEASLGRVYEVKFNLREPPAFQ